MTTDDFYHAAIVSGVVDEAAVHDAENYDGEATLAKLDAMYAALQVEPTAPLARTERLSCGCSLVSRELFLCSSHSQTPACVLPHDHFGPCRFHVKSECSCNYANEPGAKGHASYCALSNRDLNRPCKS